MARVHTVNTMAIMGHALDASMLRHEILANNIANISTPGFKRSDVSFHFELQRALDPEPHIEMKGSSARHFESRPSRDPAKVKPRVYSDLDTWTRNDRNNVDPENEMAALAQNTLYYQALTNRVGAMFRGLTGIVQKTQAF